MDGDISGMALYPPGPFGNGIRRRVIPLSNYTTRRISVQTTVGKVGYMLGLFIIKTHVDHDVDAKRSV